MEAIRPYARIGDRRMQPFAAGLAQLRFGACGSMLARQRLLIVVDGKIEPDPAFGLFLGFIDGFLQQVIQRMDLWL
jgi:hypothetical protein